MSDAMKEEKEEAFFIWWEKIESHKDSINLRMAFEAGWEVGFLTAP